MSKDISTLSLESSSDDVVFTVMYAATQNIVIMRASSCEAMRSFRMTSKMSSPGDSFHADFEGSPNQKRFADSLSGREQCSSRNTLFSNITAAKDGATASEGSSSHIDFSSTNHVEIDSAQLRYAPDFETSLSYDESTSLETFGSVDCDENVATLIVTFARANIDRYCYCCPLMCMSKSFEQAALTPVSNVASENTCTAKTSSLEYNTLGSAFEETFFRTFTSTPRKISRIDVDELFDSLEQLTKMSPHSICLVVGIEASVEVCEHLELASNSIQAVPFSQFQVSKTSRSICRTSIASEITRLPERPLYQEVCTFENLRDINHTFKTKAKAKRRILRLVRVAGTLCNIQPMTSSVTWFSPFHKTCKAAIVTRKGPSPYNRHKIQEEKVMKCPKFREKQIDEKLLDCDVYQPLDKLIKQLAKLNYRNCKENNMYNRAFVDEARGERKKIAKIKCQKCNGTISSVRFLANSTSASEYNTSESRFNSFPTVDSRMSPTKDYSPTRIHKTMPESTPFPLIDSSSLLSIAESVRLDNFKSTTSCELSNKTSCSSSSKTRTIKGIPKPSKVHQTGDLKASKETKSKSASSDFEISFSQLRFQHEGNPTETLSRGFSRVTYSAGQSSDTDSKWSVGESSTLPPPEDEETFMVPRLRLDSSHEVDKDATTKRYSIAPSSLIGHYGDTQRAETATTTVSAFVTNASSCSKPDLSEIATNASSFQNSVSFQPSLMPETPINLKRRPVPSYRLARAEQQNIYERPPDKKPVRGGATKCLGSQNTFPRTRKTSGGSRNTKESDRKRRVNFQDPVEDPAPKTPVLASTLSLTDAANILSIIDRISKNSRTSVKNSSVDKLGKIFQSQFERVSSYLQENLYNTYSYMGNS